MTTTGLNIFINTNNQNCYCILQIIAIHGFKEINDEYHIYLKSVPNIRNYRKLSPTQPNYILKNLYTPQ